MDHGYIFFGDSIIDPFAVLSISAVSKANSTGPFYFICNSRQSNLIVREIRFGTIPILFDSKATIESLSNMHERSPWKTNYPIFPGLIIVANIEGVYPDRLTTSGIGLAW